MRTWTGRQCAELQSLFRRESTRQQSEALREISATDEAEQRTRPADEPRATLPFLTAAAVSHSAYLRELSAAAERQGTKTAETGDGPGSAAGQLISQRMIPSTIRIMAGVDMEHVKDVAMNQHGDGLCSRKSQIVDV